MRMLVLLEKDRVYLAIDRNVGRERMRLRNLVDRFQESAAVANAKTWRAPSGRTVSTDRADAINAGPDSALSRKRGGTPSSNTSRTAAPSLVAMRFDSSWPACVEA